jgi:copper chaperone CopZ
MNTLKLTIAGMSCNHCVNVVKASLSALPGVKVTQVSVGQATVEYDGRPETLATIVQAVDEAGYQARPEAA